MALIDIVILLIIAAVFGGLGQMIAGISLGGCLASIVVGFIGAYLGQWAIGKFGLPVLFSISLQGRTFPVVWSIIGATAFSLIVGVVRRGLRSGD